MSFIAAEKIKFWILSFDFCGYGSEMFKYIQLAGNYKILSYAIYFPNLPVMTATVEPRAYCI